MKTINQKLWLTCLAILFAFANKAQIITTVAGNGTANYTGDGGQATDASLVGPSSVTFDATGNMYIVDKDKNNVRKITPNGIITTVVGGQIFTKGSIGDGGPAINARLNVPTTIAFDAVGNMYIADKNNYRIRKVDLNGIITTVAGNGIGAYAGDGGQATAASLFNPTQVAFDATGNMYIADYGNNRVRMVNTSGVISTYAGTGVASFSGDGGKATKAAFSGPIGLTFDAKRNLYISDRNNNRIRMVKPSGIVSTVVGNGIQGFSGDGGQAIAAELNNPLGLNFDAVGNLYVADYNNARIRMVAASGVITTYVGTGVAGYSGDGGPAVDAQLNLPTEIAIGIDINNNLYIADYGNSRVRMVTPQVPSYIPTKGLIGFWSFTGNANDVSGNGNNAVATNATLITDRLGNVNSAYSLAGNGNITAILSATQTKNWTVGGWYYKPTDVTAYNAEYFLSFGNTPNGNGLGFGGSYNACEPGYYSLYDGGNGTDACFTADNLTSKSTSVTYGYWEHLVITKTDSTYAIYRNGVVAAKGKLLNLSLNEIVMGMRADNQFNLNGSIDDIGAWSRALSSSEIMGLYIGNTPKVLPFDPTTASCAGVIPGTVDLSKSGGGSSTSSTGPTCTASSAAYTSKYSLESFYKPVANDPLITVLVDFHIFNDGSGNGSYPNTSAGIINLEQIGTWMTSWSQFANPRNANYTTSGFTSPYTNDGRVQYVLNKIYFYNDNTLNTTTNDLLLFNAVIAADPNRLNEALPVFFSNANFGGPAGYQSTFTTPSGVAGVPFIHTACVSPPMSSWWVATSHLCHELGHAMGWYHTYATGGDESQWGFTCTSPNFLSDVFPQNNGCTSAMGCGICFEVAPTYTSNNVMSGNADNSWMSQLQMGRRIMDLHLNPVRIYAQEMTSGYLNPWLITANETWDFDIQMYQDITVKSGATLTIKCKVAMADNGRIIVERGGKLVIDGGTVSAWGSSWAGIQVWGTSGQPQTIVSGLSPNHGIVQVINQGTIRDAGNGITTIKYDQSGNFDWGGYTGGIILCDGANFINNQRAIQYLSYHNTNILHHIINNIGYVRNSLFQTDNSIKSANFPPQEFVSMWDVQGIQYLGNTYQNTTSPLPSIDQRGSGFYSEDASYTIDKYQVCNLINSITGQCAHYSANNPSTFTNLQYGVQVNNLSTVTSIRVNDNDFIGCNRAVYMTNSNNSVVTNNRINIGDGQNNLTFLPYGVYMLNSSSYSISNNSITTTQWPNYNSSLGTGICISSSISTPNLVNLNNIDNMGAGTTVYGNNYGVNPGDGLQLKCNVYGQGANGKNYIDMNMALSTSGPWINGKIGNYQGSISQGANNIFSHTGNTNPNIKTDYSDNCFIGVCSSPNSVSYFYNTGSSLVQPSIYDASMNSLAASGNYSSSLCTPGGGGASGSGLATGRVAVIANTTIINDSLNKIDGGKTQALLNTIAAGKTTATALGTKLLAVGPYLSDSVLGQYLRRANNPENYVQQIVLANSPLSYNMKQLVDSLNLDSATQNTINAAQVGVSRRTILYSGVADLNSQTSLMYNTSMQNLLNDTNGLNKDSIVQLMRADNSLGANKRLLAALTFLGDYTNASALLDSISKTDSSSSANYNTVQSVILQLKKSPKGIFALRDDAGLTQTLVQVANTIPAIGDVGVTNAQAILRLVFGYKYQEFISLPNTDGAVGSTKRLSNPNTETTTATIIETSKQLKIYPNPTNGSTNVYFTTTQKYALAEVAVYDGTGKLVINQRINGNSTVCVLNTDALNSGLYLITLSFDGVVTEKQKLIKQ